MTPERDDGFALGEVWPITAERAAAKLHWKSLRTFKAFCRRHRIGHKSSGGVIFSLDEVRSVWDLMPQNGDDGRAADAAFVKRQVDRLATSAAHRRTGRRGKRDYMKG